MAARKTYPLRLDPGLYEELRRWAAGELRSVNAQIEYILRRAVDQRRRRDREAPAAERDAAPGD